jgi:hypothetical protein
MTGLEFMKEMLAEARRNYGPNAPVTKDLEEQIRAAEQAEPTTYLQYTLGAREAQEGD